MDQERSDQGATGIKESSSVGQGSKVPIPSETLGSQIEEVLNQLELQIYWLSSQYPCEWQKKSIQAQQESKRLVPLLEKIVDAQKGQEHFGVSIQTVKEYVYKKTSLQDRWRRIIRNGWIHNNQEQMVSLLKMGEVQVLAHIKKSLLCEVEYMLALVRQDARALSFAGKNVCTQYDPCMAALRQLGSLQLKDQVVLIGKVKEPQLEGLIIKVFMEVLLKQGQEGMDTADAKEKWVGMYYPQICDLVKGNRFWIGKSPHAQQSGEWVKKGMQKLLSKIEMLHLEHQLREGVLHERSWHAEGVDAKQLDVKGEQKMARVASRSGGVGVPMNSNKRWGL